MAPEHAAVDLDAVQRQLEYYFSDSNLPRDRFLLAKTEENPDGYVPLCVLLTFNRLKQLGVTSEETLAAALKSSTLLSLNDANTQVRRTNPLPEKSLFPTRAVHVKGWTPGGPEPDLDYLRQLFEPSGSVLSVQVRRWKDESGARHFKGSLFVEMANPEAAERVAAEEYLVDVEVDGQVETKSLTAQHYFDWVERKKKERQERSAKLKLKYGNSKVKSPVKPSKDEADENIGGKTVSCVKFETGPATKSESALEDDQDENLKSEVKLESKVSQRTFTPGLVLRFEGVGDDATREDIRESLEEYGTIAFVDFSTGQTEGNVRFSTPDETKRAFEGLSNSEKLVAGKKPTVRILDADDEKEYWQVAWIKMDGIRKRRRDDRGNSSYGKGNKRFRRGARFGGRGKRGARDSRRPSDR